MDAEIKRNKYPNQVSPASLQHVYVAVGPVKGEKPRGTLSSPVVVEPGAVAGDDDVVCLLRHVVLAGVHQTIHLGFALFLIVLQEASE